MLNQKNQASTVHIGLVNPKSPSNVGSVMRASGCFGVNAVYYTGERYKRAARFQTDTKNRTESIPLISCEELTEQMPEGMQLVCVELVEGAVPLSEFKHPEQARYVFGSEDGTISQALVDQADAVVYIPTVGCLNLAATVNIVLYDRQAKSTDISGGDALIRASRDTNNRVVVRPNQA